jgi:hypothetical protein
MILDTIISIIFICSLGGILFILARKIPDLNLLPQTGSAGIRDHHIILNIENKIKNILISFEKQIFLHKFLSWVKVMTLKIETRVDHLLHNIRKKAQRVDGGTKDKKIGLPK